MNNHFSIIANTVHLWHVRLSDFSASDLLALLDTTEIERAQRFRFPNHRDHYIIGRGILRQILSLYTNVPPAEIKISYGAHGKPYLAENPLNLQFNLSHSNEMAMYGLTVNKEIGVDIQKMEPIFRENIAKRFFSLDEYANLLKQADDKKITGFYRLWAAKEAFIKALGSGLFKLPHAFAMDPDQITQYVTFEEKSFLIQLMRDLPDYAAAFVVEAPINQHTLFAWTTEGPILRSTN